MMVKLCILNIMDNTGGFFMCFFGLPGFFKKKMVSVGDTISGSVTKCTSFKKKKNLKMETGKTYIFLLVQQRYNYSSLDGSFVKMSQNSVIVLNKKGIPSGTRIFKPILKELRKKYIKVFSIAYYVI